MLLWLSLDAKILQKEKGGLPRGFEEDGEEKAGQNLQDTATTPTLKAMIDVKWLCALNIKGKRKLSEFCKVRRGQQPARITIIVGLRALVCNPTKPRFHNAGLLMSMGRDACTLKIHQNWLCSACRSNKPDERFFGPGCWVAFTDADGPGHVSSWT